MYEKESCDAFVYTFGKVNESMIYLNLQESQLGPELNEHIQNPVRIPTCVFSVYACNSVNFICTISLLTEHRHKTGLGKIIHSFNYLSFQDKHTIYTIFKYSK